MANPSYYQSSPAVTPVVQHLEHRFHMYAHQQHGKNEHTIVGTKQGLSNAFGCTNVMDWGLLDAPRFGATVIGRLQGVGIGAGISSQSWFFSVNLVFTDQRFKGSTLSIQGPLGAARLPDEGAWAVVGGTGEFANAQGTIAYKRVQNDPNNGFIFELNIRVFCLTVVPEPPKPTVQKVGPWGGNGGTAHELGDDNLPKRLDSMKIYADDNAVQLVVFSFFNEAGQKQSVGDWYSNGGMTEHPTIQLGASETVKELYGATGNYGGETVVTTLTIVTNLTTYGPYGKQSQGNTPFHEVAPKNHSIVGFYGRLGQVLYQIGAYVRRDNA